MPAGQLVEVELEETKCKMPALPSVFDYLTVDVTLWAQTTHEAVITHEVSSTLWHIAGHIAGQIAGDIYPAAT